MKSKVYSSKYHSAFLEQSDREEALANSRAAGISRLFVFTNRFLNDPDLSAIPETISFFHKNEIEVGIWITTLGMGNPLPQASQWRTEGYTSLHSVSGAVAGDAYCPRSKPFRRDIMAFIKKLAELKPDMIMLDDDLTISARPGMGCFCPEHMKLFEEKLGRPCTLDDLRKKIFCGGPTVERDAWLEIMGNDMREFCREVRATIDAVDPSIRCGFCTGYTSWDIEGADAIELAKILAGKNKPFLRFTGAPYWSTKDAGRFDNQKLQTSIELTRAQQKWCEGEGIEVFHEGDTYPRPRYHVPASYLECFDIPLVAAGGMHRLKYMMDYHNPEPYEMGYQKHHLHNKPLCDFIEEHFDGKKCVGVQVCQHQRKIRLQELPAEFMGDRNIARTFFTPDATALVANGIPTTYDENPEAGVAFGEECRYLDKLPKKLYTDVKGALILQERGFDCGLRSAAPIDAPNFEWFGDLKNWYFFKTRGGKYFNCTLDEKAGVESTLELDGFTAPGSYKYKSDGTEFLILCADASTLHNSSDMLYSYPRQAQLMEFFPKYPAIEGEPFVYTLVKRDEKETAILFTNIHEDAILDGIITLDKEYKEMECFGIDATLRGDKILLNEEFHPYQSIAILLK